MSVFSSRFASPFLNSKTSGNSICQMRPLPIKIFGRSPPPFYLAEELLMGSLGVFCPKEVSQLVSLIWIKSVYTGVWGDILTARYGSLTAITSTFPSLIFLIVTSDRWWRFTFTFAAPFQWRLINLSPVHPFICHLFIHYEIYIYNTCIHPSIFENVSYCLNFITSVITPSIPPSSPHPL